MVGAAEPDALISTGVMRIRFIDGEGLKRVTLKGGSMPCLWFRRPFHWGSIEPFRGQNLGCDRNLWGQIESS